ncbi:type II secretion system protein [Thalassomonas viridans]|uniref:Type II secretion system protein n=1 Tax=Thalassomonas viridans TaxID=137584 RepID=A0AAE9Z2C6_9GAMM|nr:type II secretion system protein [Thalassomonas viridans]WDE03953.1 type II secretion system protein [Thalassomonas viridans]
MGTNSIAGKKLDGLYAGRGFTLIELIIVMAIVGLLMGLVGPLTVKGYEKIQAKEEQLTLINLLRANSYRSFAAGKPGMFSLDKNSINFRYLNRNDAAGGRILAVEPPDEVTISSNNGLAGSEPIVAASEFKYLTFLPQVLQVNSFGLISPAQITLSINGKEQVLDLSEKVNGIEK